MAGPGRLPTGALWTERYDRDFGNIFALQNEIAVAIVGGMERRLRRIAIYL